MKSTNSNLFSSVSSTNSLEDNTANDDILNALKSNTSSPLAGNTATSLTGKYSSQGGGVVDSDICSKHVNVTCLHKYASSPLCFGLIGVNKNSFCLKPKGNCRVSSHSVAIFEPDLDHYYINKNQTGESAWCEFKLHKDVGEMLKSQGIDMNDRKSLEDWKFIFSSSFNLKNEPSSKIERAIEFMRDPPKLALAMKTPAKKKLEKIITSDEKIVLEMAKIEANAALLHITQSERDEWSNNVPLDLITYIETMSDTTKNVISDIADIRSCLDRLPTLEDLSSDFTDVSSALTGLKSTLGSNTISTYPDVWTAINEIETSQISNSNQIEDITTMQKELSSRLTSCQTVLHSYGQRWTALGQNWLPLLTKHEQEIDTLKAQSSPTVDMDSLLQTGISSNQNLNTTSTHGAANTSLISKLSEQIDDLEGRLRLCEERSDNKSVSFQPSMDGPAPRRDPFGFGTAGVCFKQFYFADEDEVKVWLKKHLSTPSHGLFVDLVSFTQFFGDDSYVERNVSLNDLYISNKIGYQTMADAYVATSFENVLPAAYGRTASSTKSTSNVDMSSQPELPGLPSFAKWDHTDGGTGRKYWIMKECRKTGIQIDGMIRAQLDGVAQVLAKDLLTDSISMSEALFNFISTSYQDTFNSGRFDSDQAWQLTCKFVKRIFVELGDVRITARAGIHINDPWTSAAKFLFATLRAHEVMHSFMRLDIKNHPSISSEMVKFICYSQPASDTSEVLSRLAATESMQRTQQSNISKLDLKAKKVDTWKSETEKLLKKLKDKAEIA
jgi:hypothetical protein